MGAQKTAIPEMGDLPIRTCDGPITEGMIVRYSPKWCTPEERKYLHVVCENRLNPVTGKMTRWLIKTINTSLALGSAEDVEDYMIEPTGFAIDIKGGKKNV